MTHNPDIPELLHSLILDEAIAPIEYTAQEREQFCQQHQLNSAHVRQAWTTQHGSSAELDAWIDRQLKISKLQQAKWGKRLGSYFLQRKAQLDQVICSLIYPTTKEIAQELYFRIVEGEQSFAELARRYSQGSEAEAGGLIGPIELGQLPPELAHMLYGQLPGKVWPPTTINGRITITRLEKVIPIQLDEAMQQFLLNELLETWIQEQLQRRFPS
jgi:parvulin-like peptidyl-prolyl isomerase